MHHSHAQPPARPRRSPLLPRFVLCEKEQLSANAKIALAPKSNDTIERLKISTSVGLFRVPTDDIAYIEASGNYCDVHLFNGESVTMTFQLHYFVEVLGMLQQNFFLRVGKSLIVNKNFVYAINVTNQELKLMDYRAHHSFRLRASKEALKKLSLAQGQSPQTRPHAGGKRPLGTPQRFIRQHLVRRMNLFSHLARGNTDEYPLLRPLTLRCPAPKPHNLRTRREKTDYFWVNSKIKS